MIQQAALGTAVGSDQWTVVSGEKSACRKIVGNAERRWGKSQNPHASKTKHVAPKPCPLTKGLPPRSIAWASSQLQNKDERLSRLTKAARCERSPFLTAVNLRPMP